METMQEELKTESQRCREIFSRLCHDAGLLQFQIDRLQGDLADLMVKLHNAEKDFRKAVAAETAAHKEEATEPKGVTQ